MKAWKIGTKYSGGVAGRGDVLTYLRSLRKQKRCAEFYKAVGHKVGICTKKGPHRLHGKEEAR